MMNNERNSGKVFVFPLLMQGEIIENSGGKVVLPHRAIGDTVATGKLKFGEKPTLAKVTLKENNSIAELLKAGYEAFASIKSKEIKAGVKKASDPGGIDIEVVSDATYTCRLVVGAKNILQLMGRNGGPIYQ